MKWMSLMLVALWLMGSGVGAQTSASSGDRFKPLNFLTGTWEAKATRPDGVVVTGRYAFLPELNGTVLARHSTEASQCKASAIVNCEHSDLLYVFEDTPGAGLKAVYFDSEGHVIHYAVRATSATSAEFLSEAAGPGPQFRLQYERNDKVLLGRFQVKAPGEMEWRTYLQWSGERVMGSKEPLP